MNEKMQRTILVYCGLLTLTNNVIGIPQTQFGYSQKESNDCCEDYCYSTDENPYIYFASKTSYDSLDRKSGNQHLVPECEPIQFWSLNRHGTRLPKSATIQRIRQLTKLQDEIIRNYEQRRSYPDRGRLCYDDFNMLKRWRWNESIVPELGNSLTEQGVSELRLIARRYRAKYPQILGQPYNEQNFFFQYTDTDRTHDSYQAYIEGLFGSDFFRVHANTFSNDPLIRAYKNCEQWTEQVDNNPSTKSEYNRFIQSPAYLEMSRDIYKRLGFKFSLNSSIIHDIYDLCRFEKAWYVNQRSPWCIAFNKNQLKFLEYGEDLKYWYQTGYGNSLSEKIGCAPLQDMYRRFEDTINANSDEKKTTVLFTHSSTIQAVVTTMGLLKDYNPLTAENYDQQSRRNWRTSLFDPFSANLAAVLYKCNAGERYKIMFYMNEVPVDLPGCSVGLCSWSKIQEKFQDMVDSCNVEEFCSGNSKATLSQPWSLFTLMCTLVLGLSFPQILNV